MSLGYKGKTKRKEKKKGEKRQKVVFDNKESISQTLRNSKRERKEKYDRKRRKRERET